MRCQAVPDAYLQGHKHQTPSLFAQYSIKFLAFSNEMPSAKTCTIVSILLSLKNTQLDPNCCILIFLKKIQTPPPPQGALNRNDDD